MQHVRKLVAEKDEDDAVEGGLYSIPDRPALHARGGQRPARQLAIVHRHAGHDRGKNAGNMKMLGRHVSGERH